MTQEFVPSAPQLTGQVIGQTEHAIRAVLDRLLAAAGTTFHQWVLLRLVATTGPTIERAHLVASMTDGLKIDETTTLAVLRQVVELGLAVDAETISLTPAGTGHYHRLADNLAAITDRLYGDLPVDDLDTTRRVLSTLTERANAELAGTR